MAPKQSPSAVDGIFLKLVTLGALAVGGVNASPQRDTQLADAVSELGQELKAMRRESIDTLKTLVVAVEQIRTLDSRVGKLETQRERSGRK